MDTTTTARRAVTTAQAKLDGIIANRVRIQSSPESFPGFDQAKPLIAAGRITRAQIIERLLADQDQPLADARAALADAKATLARLEGEA